MADGQQQVEETKTAENESSPSKSLLQDEPVGSRGAQNRGPNSKARGSIRHFVKCAAPYVEFVVALLALPGFWILWQQTKLAQGSLDVSKQALDISDASMKASTRAWIGPTDSIRIELGGMNPKGIFTYKNFGNSPALDIRAHAALSLRETDKPLFDAENPRRQRSDAIEQSTSTLFPGGEGTSFADWTKTRVFNRGRIPEIEVGSIRLWLHGTIFYRDSFGDQHSTTFCYYLAKDLKGMIAGNEGCNDAN